MPRAAVLRVHGQPLPRLEAAGRQGVSAAQRGNANMNFWKKLFNPGDVEKVKTYRSPHPGDFWSNGEWKRGIEIEGGTCTTCGSIECVRQCSCCQRQFCEVHLPPSITNADWYSYGSTVPQYKGVRVGNIVRHKRPNASKYKKEFRTYYYISYQFGLLCADCKAAVRQMRPIK
jgi:hypothetical protein